MLFLNKTSVAQGPFGVAIESVVDGLLRGLTEIEALAYADTNLDEVVQDFLCYEILSNDRAVRRPWYVGEEKSYQEIQTLWYA